MRYTEYSNIIFEGLEHHKKYFQLYITRCIKKAENESITTFEFLNRLADVMRHYETELMEISIAELKDFQNNLTIEKSQNLINDGWTKYENIFIKMSSYNDIYNGSFGFAEIDLIRETILNVAKQEKTNIDILPATIPIDSETLIHFDSAAQQYLLLEELGIIGFLNEKYPLSSQTKKGLLLAYITNTKKGKSFENILSAVYNKNTESEHYPFKERNETKVNRILADIGIEKKTTTAAIKKK